MVKSAAANKSDQDDCEQRAEWKTRLFDAVIGRAFDDETLAAMISAGLDQAYEEGVSDAADVCGACAKEAPAFQRRVLLVLEKALRQLILLNRNTAGQSS